MLVMFYVLLTYMVGSIPTGVIISTLYADADVRGMGSQNIGATNVLRVVGPRYGAVTLVGDLLKGFVPVALTAWLFPDITWLPPVVAVSAFVGHCWSCYLEFRGGKGVATAAGTLLALDPLALVLLAGLWVLVFAVWRKASIAALVAAAALPIVLALMSPEILWVGLVFALAIIVRHRENIKRLLGGKEL